MKYILYLVISVTLFFAGFMLSNIFNEGNIENINEDIVSSEIKVLSLAIGALTPCNRLSKTSGWVFDDYAGYSIFWKNTGKGEKLVKHVISFDYSSATEVLDNTCP